MFHLGIGCGGPAVADAGGVRTDQYSVYRTLECDLAHLDARAGATHTHTIGGARTVGGGVVLDRLRVQLLSCLCKLGEYTSHGCCSDRFCILYCRASPL